ncbi:hypothetical protein AX769_20880 (plasmid) [Frondihabitans sp. PAMC 28766]|uniref:hypothetical protein n=1 Tax=Frondihabitans sp. PAMC 28766 TaxID=1795630 RepID=UPI00078BEE9F|nr:hypothetical protein [Frondihabitans sp. PAMC 28766]AMM22600.1 hypothetical protein AX769_20880 [Frondihabitans sp. PAMC 28766]
MATRKDPLLWFRVLLGISVWIVLAGLVGLVSTIPQLFAPHHATTVQAFIFALVAFVVGVLRYRWSRRNINAGTWS